VEAARDEFVAANPTKSLEITSDAPLGLVQRVRDGEVPDIFICLGETEIGTLEREGYLDRASRRVVGTLVPVIAVPQGNPARVREPADLLLDRVRSVAIAGPGAVSMGTDAKHELERAKMWSELQDKLAVKETALGALEAVSAGEVDAAILYDPCPRLNVGGDIRSDSVSPITPLAEAADRPARICAEVHKRSPNGLLAQRFLRILTERGIEALSLGRSETLPAERRSDSEVSE
jgi:ABC-type molybdate transport system substrate-binding protein